MDFKQAVLFCAQDKTFVKEFNRLTGCSLGEDNRHPLEYAVDKACGYDPVEDEAKRFILFVKEFVWDRL